MSTKNTGSLTQFPRTGAINVTTANGGSLTAPTNTGLVYVAGPDGTDIWSLAAIATAAQTSAQTIQLYISRDYGVTFTALPMTGSFAAGAVSGSTVNISMPNGIPMLSSNPVALGGSVGAFTHYVQQSGQYESTTWFQGQYPSGGAANVQTLANAYNYLGTLSGAALSQGRIFDFVAGFTNSGATTLAIGAGAATAVQKFDGTALVGAEITKGFRYRVIDTGAAFILLPTDRLYAAITQTQALTLTAWGTDR